MTTTVPPLDEFIDLSKRRDAVRRETGFHAMNNRVTVAVYPAKGTAYQILTIRFSEDVAAKHRLLAGMRMTCKIHPDGQHIALTPGGHKRNGSKIFQPKGSKALVYQTTLKHGMLPEHTAVEAEIRDADGGAVIVSFNPDGA